MIADRSEQTGIFLPGQKNSAQENIDKRISTDQKSKQVLIWNAISKAGIMGAKDYGEWRKTLVSMALYSVSAGRFWTRDPKP